MKTRLIATALICLGALLGLHAGAAPVADYADEQGQVVQYDGEQYIRVTNARQLLRSIISGKNILVAAQTEINLTPLLDDAAWWQHNNPCFAWINDNSCPQLQGQRIVSQEVPDGRQLTLVNYHDIKIVGESDGNCGILVEARYAFCLNLVNCENITIRNLSIGHTDDGHCEGGVVGVTGGSGIEINACDLYGCGTYGLQLKDTRRFTMCDSQIHDCTYGIMTLNNVDLARFESCSFFRNREYSLIEGNDSDVTFFRCRFYDNNPTSPLFNLDRPFELSYCFIVHPPHQLGTIDLAEQTGNRISSVDVDPDTFLENGFDTHVTELHFEGSKPTIIDFINATLPEPITDEGDCSNWARDWKSYQRTGKTHPNVTVTVDERNGYVRIESKYDGTVVYADFCYWNCDDGQHKLFARSNGVIEGGKGVETECTGLSFYSYDNNTHLLSYIGFDTNVLGGRPTDSNETAYQLPRSGKDLTYVDGNGRRGTLRWNGNGFGQTRINHNPD